MCPISLQLHPRHGKHQRKLQLNIYSLHTFFINQKESQTKNLKLCITEAYQI